jgi:adenylate kinase
MLNIVLFGPPGAGKGTQSEKMIEKYGLVHFSTGDILRSEISAGTELGLKAKEIMDRGELVSDDVVIGMISSKIENNLGANGFIFDGFPRTQAQAKALDLLLDMKGSGITMMISLEVADEELMKRLLERGKVSGRADDQNVEIIENRIEVYKEKTTPVKEYYAEQSKLVEVNGVGSIAEVGERIDSAISAVEAER